MSPGTLPSWSRDKACGLKNPRQILVVWEDARLPPSPQGYQTLTAPALPPLTRHCSLCLGPLWLMSGRTFTAPPHANSPGQVKQPLYFPLLIHGLRLSRPDTDFRGDSAPHIPVHVFVSQGSWEFICLFLSAGQTQAPLRPLLTVGRDDVLLMILERLGAASRTLSFWSCGLGCLYHPRASGSFPISCFATGTSSQCWLQSLKQS